MRKYEVMFIVKPTLDEASIKQVFENTKKVFTDNNATVLEEKEMGQRDLAYEIKKFNNGYYFLLTVEASTEAINEFNRISNISSDIIRSLVTNLED